MDKSLHFGNIASAAFAVVLLIVGVLNMVLVHPVPGLMYFMLAILYVPATNSLLRKKLGFGVPAIVKIALGIVIIMFTLGVSDLGDMIDKL
ncbi:hypothetical protein [Pontibacter fetidus]|uniref:Uncharacterized protein n=1 Tax=Pontibacter fetidus TaxID=2700082 RepID=A0A6B2H3C8_9BACT|nr:hypothetical protein [Pontibacter fetidus]NDK56598.1 hypothetical protein [Pontibacter fetidus]